MVETHRDKYTALCEAMGRLIEKQSHDHRSEEIGPEKDSWIWAIEALVGKPGVS